MREATELLKVVVCGIQDVYVRPRMYGPSPLEIDNTLLMLHWFWGEILDRLETLAETKELLTSRELRLAGTYGRAYWHDHPDGTEEQGLLYVCDLWKKVSRHLGII